MSLSFDEFVTARGPAMQRMSRGLLRNPADAEDLVQDVLAKALIKWRRIEKADDPVAYVNRMLINESVSFWRRAALHREESRAPETMPEPVVRDGSEQVGDRDVLLSAVRTLPFKQRAVVALRYLDDMSDERIGDILDMTPGAVRVNASRGLAGL